MQIKLGQDAITTARYLGSLMERGRRGRGLTTKFDTPALALGFLGQLAFLEILLQRRIAWAGPIPFIGEGRKAPVDFVAWQDGERLRLDCKTQAQELFDRYPTVPYVSGAVGRYDYCILATTDLRPGDEGATVRLVGAWRVSSAEWRGFGVLDKSRLVPHDRFRVDTLESLLASLDTVPGR